MRNGFIKVRIVDDATDTDDPYWLRAGVIAAFGNAALGGGSDVYLLGIKEEIWEVRETPAEIMKQLDEQMQPGQISDELGGRSKRPTPPGEEES